MKFGTNTIFKFLWNSVLMHFPFLWNSLQVHFSNFYEIRYKCTFHIFMKFGTSILFKFLWNSVEVYFQIFSKFGTNKIFKFYEIRYKWIFQIFVKFGTSMFFRSLWNSVKVYFSKRGISVSFLKTCPVLKGAKKSSPVIAIFLDRSGWNSVYGIPDSSVEPLWVSRILVYRKPHFTATGN